MQSLPLLLILGLLQAPAAEPQSPAVTQTPAPAPPSRPASRADLVDDELEPWRVELLELAYGAASAFPLEPHVKNRSRAQESVAEAALELGQFRRVRRYADGIANWRRGSVLGELGLALIERGLEDEAQPVLDSAAEAAEGISADEAQGWRRDRVVSKLALADLQLGREVDPRLEIESSEQVRLRADRMRRATEEELELELELYAQAVEVQDFEATKAALAAYVELHDRFYADEEQRARFEALIRGAWGGIPIPVAVQSELAMIETALEHENLEDAQRLVDGAIEHVAGARWTVEHRVPLEGRLAELNHLAGRPEEARAQADAAYALFDAEAETIVNIYRSEALLPLAEAYTTLGQPATSGTVYLRALEEAWVNPNSRPRAEDFAALCCSIATGGAPPSEELLARLRSARGELGDPW